MKRYPDITFGKLWFKLHRDVDITTMDSYEVNVLGNSHWLNAKAKFFTASPEPTLLDSVGGKIHEATYDRRD